MIKNYTKKKLESRARLAVTDDPKIVEMFETIRDDDLDETIEISRGTTRVKHLNDLIADATARRDAFVASYQPQLDRLNKEVENLKDIKADVRLLTNVGDNAK